MTARKPARPWTPDDTRTLRRLARRGLALGAIAEQMARDRSVIGARAERHGIEVQRVCSKTRWTEDEDLILDALYAFSTMDRLRELLPGRTESMIFNRANGRGLKKSAQFMSQMHGARLQSHPSVHASRFQPGLVPWNKGQKGSTGTHPNCRRTQFKKGELRGAAQHNYKPVGTLRLSKDGYLQRKAHDDGPYPAARWQFVHRLVWEQHNGPVPPGHMVVFKPGLRTNVEAEITIDRVELVTRAENMRRNSYHTHYPPEVARLIQLRGALNRKIRNRRKQREEQDAGRA